MHWKSKKSQINSAPEIDNQKVDNEPQKQQQGGRYFTRHFMNFFTNTTYMIDDVFTTKIQFNAKHPNVYLLGKHYSYQQTLPSQFSSSNKQQHDQKLFSKDFQQIFWFSYRENITICRNDKLEVISDVGWGCLIRVAQMLMAQCIARHYCDSLDQLTDDIKRHILSMFSDFETNPISAPYSIQAIIKRASQIDYNIQIGEWYTGNSFILNKIQGLKIMSIIEELQEQSANKRFGDFKIINFFEQCIDEHQIIQLQNTQRASMILIQEEQKQFHGFFNKLIIQFVWQYSLLIIVHTRLSMNNIPANYAAQIKQLMMIPQFIGAIGGKKSKAYYILGFQDDNILYIDPHYVNQSFKCREDEEKNMNQYFIQSPKATPITNLSSSIGFCFYIRDQEDYFNFKATVQNVLGNDQHSIFTVYTSKEPKAVIEPQKSNLFDFELV